jgi:hypothetical protein
MVADHKDRLLLANNPHTLNPIIKETEVIETRRILR